MVLPKYTVEKPPCPRGLMISKSFIEIDDADNYFLKPISISNYN